MLRLQPSRQGSRPLSGKPWVCPSRPLRRALGTEPPGVLLSFTNRLRQTCGFMDLLQTLAFRAGCFAGLSRVEVFTAGAPGVGSKPFKPLGEAGSGGSLPSMRRHAGATVYGEIVSQTLLHISCGFFSFVCCVAFVSQFLNVFPRELGPG